MSDKADNQKPGWSDPSRALLTAAGCASPALLAGLAAVVFIAATGGGAAGCRTAVLVSVTIWLLLTWQFRTAVMAAGAAPAQATAQPSALAIETAERLVRESLADGERWAVVALADQPPPEIVGSLGPVTRRFFTEFAALLTKEGDGLAWTLLAAAADQPGLNLADAVVVGVEANGLHLLLVHAGEDTVYHAERQDDGAYQVRPGQSVWHELCRLAGCCCEQSGVDR